MSEQTVYQENVFFKPMQFLYGLLNNEIQDPNQDRSTQANPKARQWLFPEVPEANDENYPRIAIIPGTVSLEEYGAGRYIETVTDDTGGWISETRGVIASIPVTIGVFVKKKQSHSVQELDGSFNSMQNKKLADYLAYEVLRVLVAKRPEFIRANMEIQEVSASEAYEDNQFLYAADVTFTIKEWLAIEETFDPAGLIAQIDLTINIAGGPVPPPPVPIPPTITMPVFIPSPPDPLLPLLGDPIYASDGAAPGSVRFLWEVNDVTVRDLTYNSVPSGSQITDTLPTGNFTYGDEVKLSVTPYDGVAYGTTQTLTENAPAALEITDAHNLAIGGSGSSSEEHGFNIVPSSNIDLVSVTLLPGSNPPRIRLRDAAGMVLHTVAGTGTMGETIPFVYSLIAGTTYRIEGDASGGSYTREYVPIGAPVVHPYVTWVTGSYFGADNVNGANIESITFTPGAPGDVFSDDAETGADPSANGWVDIP